MKKVSSMLKKAGSMKKMIGLILCSLCMTSLCGCQIGSDLNSLSSSLDDLASKSTQNVAGNIDTKSSVHNKWGVKDSQAMQWLEHDNSSWDDHGKLRNVNWYTFWSMQIHADTVLANKANKYCSKSSWDTSEVGANCEVFFQAYSMTKSEESREHGRRMEEAL